MALARLPPLGEKVELSTHLLLNGVSALLSRVPESPLICRTSWRGSTFSSPPQDPGQAPHRILLPPTVRTYVPTLALHPSQVIGRNMPNNGLNALNCVLGDGYSGTFHAVCISPQFQKRKSRDQELLLQDGLNSACRIQPK